MDFPWEKKHPAIIWLIIWLYKYSPGWNHQPVMIDQRCRSPPEDLNAALDQHLGILGADRDLGSGQKWHEMAQTCGVNIEFRGCTLWRWLVCGDIWDMIYTLYIYILMNMQSNQQVWCELAHIGQECWNWSHKFSGIAYIWMVAPCLFMSIFPEITLVKETNIMEVNGLYPLVNIQKTTENHHAING